MPEVSPLQDRLNYRTDGLTEVFDMLDVDSNGAIEGQQLIDRIELLDLGDLRTAGAQISALLTSGMTREDFIEVAFSDRSSTAFTVQCSLLIVSTYILRHRGRART